MSLSHYTIGDILRKHWKPFEDKEDKMKSLEEHNKAMMEKYGLEGRKWKLAGVLCPTCLEEGSAETEEFSKEVELLVQIGIVHTTNPPKQKVRCPDCGIESYMIV